MSWWTDWESNPARVACKASLRPGGRPKGRALGASLDHDPIKLNQDHGLAFGLSMIFFRKPVPTFRDHALEMVLGRGFAPRSPALQAGAFTRLAFRAHQRVRARLDARHQRVRARLDARHQRVHARLDARMVRTPVIETRSSEWHSDARPSSYVRMVGNGRNRTSCPKGPRLQRSDGTSLSLLAFPGIGCSGSNRTTYLVGMSHASCQCSTLRQRLRGLNSLACARSPSVRSQNWRTAEVLIPNALQHPSRFERARGTRRVDCPLDHDPIRLNRDHGLVFV